MYVDSVSEHFLQATREWELEATPVEYRDVHSTVHVVCQKL